MMAHAPSELRGSVAAFKSGARPTRDRLIDGRHLGCGVLQISSRRPGGCGPQPSRAASRKRGDRRPRASDPSPGRGDREVRSQEGVSPRRERRATSTFGSDAQHPGRNLQSALQRSHDTRCPSGSGRGRAVLALTRKSVSRRAGRRESTRPWPVKPRLAAAARRVGSRPRVEHLRRCPPLGKPARRASASRGRHEGGSQAVVAVVLADCIDCRSRRAALGPRSKDRGSSSMARMPRGARAHRVKRRRKPDRGGESHQHASSETGGGLLVIPRAGAQAFCATGGGSTRTTEGVLARGERRL
jgi:hypothetical protein